MKQLRKLGELAYSKPNPHPEGVQGYPATLQVYEDRSSKPVRVLWLHNNGALGNVEADTIEEAFEAARKAIEAY